MREQHLAHYPRIFDVIVRTYLLRWSLWGWAPISVGLGVLVSSPALLRFVLKGAEPDLQLSLDQLVISTVFLSIGCAHLASLVAAQTEALLALPFNHTTPKLRGPAIAVAVTVTVAALMLAIFLWPRPLLVQSGAGMLWGAGAIASLVAAEAAWLQVWSQFRHFGLAPLLMGMLPWLAFIFKGVRGTVTEMLLSRHHVLAAMLYAVAGMLFVLLWVALWHRRQSAAGATGARSKSVEDQSADTGGAATQPVVTRRPQLLRLVAAAGASDWMLGVVGGTLVAAVAILLEYLFGPAGPGIPIALSLVLSIVAPIMMSTRAGIARPVLLAFDRLFPVSRRQFAIQRGWALLSNLFIFWSVSHVCMIATFALLAPSELHPVAGSLAGVLLVAGAFEIFFFGSLAWCLSFRPTIAMGICCFTFGFSWIPFAVAVFNPERHPAIPVAMIGAAALFAMGILLSVTALARWSRAEIV